LALRGRAGTEWGVLSAAAVTPAGSELGDAVEAMMLAV
jgi:hypothetical protein